jgi:hypothetical protein
MMHDRGISLILIVTTYEWGMRQTHSYEDSGNTIFHSVDQIVSFILIVTTTTE